MARIDTVYERLSELTRERGIDAGQLAEALGLARSNVSGDLNRLCDEGLASKEGSKPVLYRALARPTKRKDSVFDRFLRISPSLHHAAEQAKAAVLYPPRGMPMLLAGETGVGKSKFAEIIYEYALETERLKRSAPFVVFNCADYANNPQLLVGHLFGSKKGAFTGADADRPGLLEKADGGVLFLDEVHRLPPEGQEMLFSFLDRGCYRRLGDPDVERRADVLIITATTETPASALLRTFTRRIPMTIQIPTLAERSLDERLGLIKYFFNQEAQRLGRSIKVSVNAVRALLAYQCPNNLGQLKSDIQLLCAKAYSDLITRRNEAIEIATANLPPHIKEGLISETCHRQLWNSLSNLGRRFFVFGSDAGGESALPDESERAETVYDLIDLRVQQLLVGGLDERALTRELDENIAEFFSKDCDGSNVNLVASRVRELVGEEVDRTVSEMLRMAESRLDHHFPPSVKSGLSIHVMNAINRIRAGRKISNPEFEATRKNNPEEFGAAVECLKLLDNAFELSMPLEEAGFIAKFFVLAREKVDLLARPAVVVMAHGDGVATSMAKTCNDLLGIDAVFGIDVPLRESPLSAYARLKEGLADRAPKSDLMLLVDMGSLLNFGLDLEKELGIKVSTIPLVSTLHVLEAARRSLMGLSLEKITEEVRGIDELMAGDADPALAQAALPEVGYVVTLCTTGEGTAELMRSRLAEALEAERPSVEIIALATGDRRQVEQRVQAIARKGRVYCIVSPFPLDLGYTEFGVEDVLLPEGLVHIQEHVRREVLFDKIVAAHADTFSRVDPREALQSARDFLDAVESGLGRELLEGVRVGVYCHLASMLERLKKGEVPPDFPDRKGFISENQDAYLLVKNEATRLEERFDVRLGADEICYIVSFLHPGNCSRPPIGMKTLVSL